MSTPMFASPTHSTPSIAFVSSVAVHHSLTYRSLCPATTPLTQFRAPRCQPHRRAHLRHLRYASVPAHPTAPRACAAVSADAASSTVDHPLGPPDQPPRLTPRFLFQGLRDDLRRRLPLYLSDWRDGLRFKSIPTILFLYFACLAPVVAFGGITASLTNGSMGVIEFILSSGMAGMLYSILSAQPLTFIAPTGLTLAFVTALYGFCSVSSLPFLPIYAWVGIWTSLNLVLASFINASDIIKYCTRFTDDIFNSLIATNFLYEASRSIAIPFLLCGANKTAPFMAAALAFGTFLTGRFLTGLRTSRYFVGRVRSTLSDFGPILAIASMSALAAIPAIAKIGLDSLAIPTDFSLAGGRALLIPLLSIPLSMRLLAIIPAMLLTCLFFLDQNISVRVVNSPAHNLKKGPGYHLDLFILAICTFLCSLTGLPWMCAGTVQSLNHVRTLAEVGTKDGSDYIVSVQENRLTGFGVHAAILSTLFLLPVVKRIPMPVISGLFLYLGATMMSGNEFLSRIRYLFMDPSRYPENSPMTTTAPAQVHLFTMLQIACLAVLWVLKLNKKTSMFFPSVIATLMFIRSRVVPRIFPSEIISKLDAELVETESEVPEKIHSSDGELSPAS